MRILRMFLVIAAVAAHLPTAACAEESRAEFVNRLTSWMTIGAGSASADGQAPAPIQVPRWLTQDPYCAEDLYCENGDCGYCNNCCCQWDVFGSAEMLLWWAKGTHLPPLLTTAPDNTTSPIPGALDQPDTQVLFGNQIVGKSAQSGGRITMGVWLDPERNVSVAGRFFGLGGDANRFSASSDNFTYLLRPFSDASNANAQETLFISVPGVVEGNFSARTENNNVLGVEAYSEIMLNRDCNRRVNLFFGYQFLRLDDSLLIESAQILPNTSTIELTDNFIAHNEFHGGTFGFRGCLSRGVWSLDALGKVGFGNMRQRVQISGEAVSTSNLGVVTTEPRGFLAQPSNIGDYVRDQFCFVPEMTLNLKYHISRNLNFHVGYNLIFVSNVATTGDQIDLRLAIPSDPNLPAFAFRDDDYWLQGMNFGVNWDF